MLRSWIRYLVILILMGILALLYNTNVTFVLFFACLALPAGLFVLGILTVPWVRVSGIHAARTVSKGEEFTIAIEVQNRGIFPTGRVECKGELQNYFTGKGGRIKLIGMAAPGSRQIWKIALRAEYCGKIRIAPRVLYVCDPFGLWRFRRRVTENAQVLVLPNRDTDEEPDISENPEVYSDVEKQTSERVGKDPTEFLGLKEYAPGDRLNQIHWKKSIAADRLYVRENGDFASGRCLILLDMAGKLFEELFGMAPGAVAGMLSGAACGAMDGTLSGAASGAMAGTLSRNAGGAVSGRISGEEGLPVLDRMIETSCALSGKLIEKKIDHYLAWYSGDSGAVSRVEVDSEEALYEALGRLYDCRMLVRGGETESGTADSGTAIRPGEQFAHIYYVCGAGFELVSAAQAESGAADARRPEEAMMMRRLSEELKPSEFHGYLCAGAEKGKEGKADGKKGGPG